MWKMVNHTISYLPGWWKWKSMTTHSTREIVGNGHSHILLVGTGTAPLEGILAINNSYISI